MKLIFNKLFYSLGTMFLLVGIISCEDTSSTFTVVETAPVTLSDLDLTEIELDQNNPTNPVATFVWTAADYGQPAAENYQLEVASDEAFTAPVMAASLTGITNVTLTVRELNAAASSAGLNPFEWGVLYARIVSSLGAQDGLPVASNTISFSVFPYFNYPYTDLYFVGPACASGWNNNNNNPALFRDADDPNVFKYTGLFNADQLKILEIKGAWAPQYGEGNQGELSYRPTEDDPDPTPIDDITNSGYYTFTANISTLTFTIAPADGSADALTSLSISGSALTAPVSLQQYAVGGPVFDPHIWQNLSVHLTPGEFVFTANGSQDWGGDTSFSGVATAGGNPIQIIVEDDYEVWFNDLTGEYILIPLNL